MNNVPVPMDIDQTHFNRNRGFNQAIKELEDPEEIKKGSMP